MLIQFSVENFFIFKEKATLSMVATNNDKTTRIEENVIKNDLFNLKILKSAVIYGANASGKTKLINALHFLKNFIIESNYSKKDGIPVEPFRLNTDTEKKPSEFEIIFIYKKKYYRYGFVLNREKVLEEWLYIKEKSEEIELYHREEQELTFHSKIEENGKILQQKKLFNPDALVLTILKAFGENIAVEIVQGIKDVRVLSGLKTSYYRYTLDRLQKDNKFKKNVMRLLGSVDFGIIDLQEDGFDLISPFIITLHKQRNKFKEEIEKVIFSMDFHESEGTRQFIQLLGPILDILENGRIMVIDELDSKLHPNLVHKIIALFNSKEFNPKNAQLIFNTHNSNLLSSGLFRRDQIWFTEKNEYEEAELYSLSDIKGVGNNAPFEDNYIRGVYGAVPNLSFKKARIKINSNES